MSLLLLILLILIICSLFGGFYAPWGWSPLGILVLILIILAITGHL